MSFPRHKSWRDFCEQVESRLEAGSREYGNRSFKKSLAALLDEISEEIMDIVGWSWVLSERIAELRSGVELHTEACTADEDYVDVAYCTGAEPEKLECECPPSWSCNRCKE